LTSISRNVEDRKARLEIEELGRVPKGLQEVVGIAAKIEAEAAHKFLKLLSVTSERTGLGKKPLE
jgi:hypothetical protein